MHVADEVGLELRWGERERVTRLVPVTGRADLLDLFKRRVERPVAPALLLLVIDRPRDTACVGKGRADLVAQLERANSIALRVGIARAIHLLDYGRRAVGGVDVFTNRGALALFAITPLLAARHGSAGVSIAICKHGNSLDIATQKSKPILKENWDVEFVGVSESGKYSFTISNADGTPKVALTETATHKVAALPLAPLGAAWALFDNTRSGAYLMGFSKRDRYLGAMLRSDTSPAAPFVLDLKEGKAIRISDPLPASLKDRVMVSGSSVRIPSFDGKEVPAYV